MRNFLEIQNFGCLPRITEDIANLVIKAQYVAVHVFPRLKELHDGRSDCKYFSYNLLRDG